MSAEGRSVSGALVRQGAPSSLSAACRGSWVPFLGEKNCPALAPLGVLMFWASKTDVFEFVEMNDCNVVDCSAMCKGYEYLQRSGWNCDGPSEDGCWAGALRICRRHSGIVIIRFVELLSHFYCTIVNVEDNVFQMFQ